MGPAALSDEGDGGADGHDKDDNLQEWCLGVRMMVRWEARRGVVLVVHISLEWIL